MLLFFWIQNVSKGQREGGERTASGGGAVAVAGAGGLGVAVGAGVSGGRTAVAQLGGREEVAAVAAALALGVAVGVAGGAGALGTGGNALDGVVGLGVAGAGDLVARSDTAEIGVRAWTRNVSETCTRSLSRVEIR